MYTLFKHTYTHLYIHIHAYISEYEIYVFIYMYTHTCITYMSTTLQRTYIFVDSTRKYQHTTTCFWILR